MNFYEKYCLPHLIDVVCGLKIALEQRSKVVPLAEGRVLEVGIGSGLNIPFYDTSKVDLVWGLEPSAAMLKMVRKKIKRTTFELRYLELSGEEIPLDNNSVDTVLLTLCTITEWLIALQQMRRVLKPGGKLIFCKYGLAPDKNIQLWQHRINPVWNKIAGGCHLNRPIPEYLRKAGFNIQQLETCCLSGSPKFAGFNYLGIAGQPLQS